MNAKPTFEAESAGGWEAAEYFQDYSPPPRSAKFVVALSWSWSPAHSRDAQFWLCTDRERSAWYLYEQDSDYDTGKKLYACIATGKPYRGIDAKYAAEQMLLQVWKDQSKEYESDDHNHAHVDSPGLLNDEDIARLEQVVIDFIDSERT